MDSALLERPCGSDDVVVKATIRASRRVQKIPALLVAMLKDAEKLPPHGQLIEPGLFGFRFPNLEDMMRLEWAAEWDATDIIDANGMRTAMGLIGYWDHFDWHTSSDVREVAFLAGSPRAAVHLIRWVRAEATTARRRVITSFGPNQLKLARLLERLGAEKTREVFEA